MEQGLGGFDEINFIFSLLIYTDANSPNFALIIEINFGRVVTCTLCHSYNLLFGFKKLKYQFAIVGMEGVQSMST